MSVKLSSAGLGQLLDVHCLGGAAERRAVAVRGGQHRRGEAGAGPSEHYRVTEQRQLADLHDRALGARRARRFVPRAQDLGGAIERHVGIAARDQLMQLVEERAAQRGLDH